MNEALTWILIANSSHARVVATDRRLRTWDVVEDLEHPESRMRARHIMADDRGRTSPRDRSSVRRAAMTPKTPAQKVEVERFGREVAEVLRAGHGRNAFGRLVLVAPPEFLGRVRSALAAPVASTVWAEINKNLVDDRLEVVMQGLRDTLLTS